jgi:Ala-tRNA(Pro) deacylase
MPVSRLTEFLDEHKVKYVTISHSPAYTAQGVAASAHVPGRELAKTVIFKTGDKLAMAVLPAPYKVDFDLLAQVVGVDEVELASEEEFQGMFPGCEVGAMPPFGNLYGIPVFVAESLAEDVEIAFNACSHVELIKMAFEDFARLVKPTLGRFSSHR